MKVARVVKAKSLREGDQLQVGSDQFVRIVEVDSGGEYYGADKPSPFVWVRCEGHDDPERLPRKARVVVLR